MCIKIKANLFHIFIQKITVLFNYFKINSNIGKVAYDNPTVKTLKRQINK